MKRIILIILALSSISIFAQNKTRQLLKNEAIKSERSVEKSVSAYHYGNDRVNYSRRGDSEVFLQISEGGYFTVEIGNQMMSTPYGKFRFFEVNSGRNVLSIYKNGFLIYRTRISVPVSSRMILSLSYNSLYLMDVYHIHNQNDVWIDDVCIDDSYNGNFGYGRLEMNAQEFTLFKGRLESINFDKDRIDLIEMQLSTGTEFRAIQIREMLKTFDFEKAKLRIAKKLYLHCIDTRNYYLVMDEFDFSSSKRELNRFIRENPRTERR